MKHRFLRVKNVLVNIFLDFSLAFNTSDKRKIVNCKTRD